VEFEELTKNVEHAIVSMSVVLEMALGLNPVEEIEGALPVVAVGREGFSDGGRVEFEISVV
jgi:hypothetical protein